MNPPAKDFTELIAWQLATELKRQILVLAARAPFARDRKLADQLIDSAASAPRNIAEGFGRFNGKDFASFLRIALGSLHETRNNLLDAFDRGYITPEERDRCVALSRRAVAATTRLRAYLLSPDNRMSTDRERRSRSSPRTRTPARPAEPNS